MNRIEKALAMLRRAELSQLYDERATRRRIIAAARVLMERCVQVKQQRGFGLSEAELAQESR